MPTGLPEPADAGHRATLIKRATQVMIVISIFAGVSVLAWPGGPWTWSRSIGIAALLLSSIYAVALWLNHKGHHDAAGRILVTALTAGMVGAIALPGGFEGGRSFAFVAIAPVVAAAVLTWRGTAVAAAANLAGLAFAASQRPAYLAGPFEEDMLVIATIGAILVSLAAYNDRTQAAGRRLGQQRDQAIWQMDAMLDNGPDAVLFLTDDGTVLRLNAGAERWSRKFLGTTLAPGAHLQTVLGTQGWERVAGLLGPAAKNRANHLEMRLDTTRGTRWADIHVSPVQGPEACFVAQIRDVTEAKSRAAKDMRAYEHRIQETSEHELDVARSRLLNRASHEMRTPLTPLRLQVSILEKQDYIVGNPKAAKSIETIKRNVTRLSRLVEDLLDASALEADDLVLKRKSMELAPLIEAEVEAYRPRAEHNGLTLRSNIEQTFEANVDPHRLTQVVGNLLSNACKYGRTAVDVTAQRQGDEVLVCVADNGVGFTAERAKELWQPFTPAAGDPEQLAGTGLGLYICKRLVAEHGGRIWAESPGPGKGSRFCFTLPARASLKYEATPIDTYE